MIAPEAAAHHDPRDCPVTWECFSKAAGRLSAGRPLKSLVATLAVRLLNPTPEGYLLHDIVSSAGGRVAMMGPAGSKVCIKLRIGCDADDAGST